MKIMYTYIVKYGNNWTELYECHKQIGNGISSTGATRHFFIRLSNGNLAEIKEDEYYELIK